ncbi:MAG: matrixin family metalloprotease [Myxococcota bacterium]
MTRAILGLACAVCLLAPTRAAAFTPMTTTTGKELHWVSSEMPVPFFIESTPSNISDGSDIRAVRNSFAEWEKPRCSYLRFEEVEKAEETGGRACGGQRNTIAWMEQGWPPDLGKAVVGITMTCFEPGGGILGARIVFNGQHHEWATDGRSSAIDVANVATHEIGHFVGMGHTDVPNTTMWPTTSNGDISQRSLHADDLEGICYLYPRSQPWAPGNGTSMLEGARETAERLGVDKAGGCAAPADSAQHGAGIILALLCTSAMLRRWRPSRRA